MILLHSIEFVNSQSAYFQTYPLQVFFFPLHTLDILEGSILRALAALAIESYLRSTPLSIYMTALFTLDTLLAIVAFDCVDPNLACLIFSLASSVLGPCLTPFLDLLILRLVSSV